MKRDAMLVVNCLRGQWEVKDGRYRRTAQRLQNEVDQAQILSMTDHSDLHPHTFREWNEEAELMP